MSERFRPVFEASFAAVALALESVQSRGARLRDVRGRRVETMHSGIATSPDDGCDHVASDTSSDDRFDERYSLADLVVSFLVRGNALRECPRRLARGSEGSPTLHPAPSGARQAACGCSEFEPGVRAQLGGGDVLVAIL